MAAAPGLIPGFVVAGLAIALSAFLVALTYRFARGREVVIAMIQRSFLPEKRRSFLLMTSTEGAAVLLTAIVWGLTVQGWIPAAVGDTATALLLIVAALTVGIMTWYGYAPSRLTADERRSLAAEAPEVFQSLIMAPLLSDDPASDVGTRSRPRQRPASSGGSDPDRSGTDRSPRS